jgi:type IV secretion system protein VirB5
MMRANRQWMIVLCLLPAVIPTKTRAQFAVIDVGAIAQLVKEVAALGQELETAQNQLTQAETQFASMTGNRGMQSLLSGTNRNYLPMNAAQLLAAVTQTGTAYTAYSSGIQSLVQANAVLTPAQVSALSPAEQSQLLAARQSAAMLQMTANQALSTTSARFASLQQLISAIPSATDQKGILELEARIAAEQAMLQNESTKLNTLYQSSQAAELTRNQRMREQALSDVGSLRTLPALQLP